MQTILGKHYRDVVSTFYGVATGKAEYLNGLQKTCVTSSSLENGRPVEEWFDDSRLEEVQENGTRIGFQASDTTAAAKGAR